MKTQITSYSNILHRRIILAIATFACSASYSLLAQSELPPVPPGSYYTTEGYLVPEASGGGMHADDSGPPFPGTNTSGTNTGCPYCPVLPDYGKGFYLTITPGAESNSYVVSLENTTNGLPYVLEVATNLAGPWFTNQSLLATNLSPVTNMLAQPILMDTNYPALFFRAFQATPSQLRWKVPLIDIATETNRDNYGNGLSSAPSLSPDGQTIYMTAPNRTVSAIEAATGTVLWTDSIFTLPSSHIPQQAEFTGSAAVTSSNIYVGGCDGNLYCLNATNGFTNWIKTIGETNAIYGTPAIDASGRILVPTDEGLPESGAITGVTCLVPTTSNATVAWYFQPQDLHDPPSMTQGGDVESSLAVANNGTIYFLAEGWRLYSLDSTGKLNWFMPMQATSETLAQDPSVAIDSFGRVLSGCNSEYIYCINPDGSLEWTLPLGPLNLPQSDSGPMVCSPTIGSNDVLYAGSGGNSGAVIALDSSGDTNWIISPSGAATFSSPAVGETTLYYGSPPGPNATSAELFAVNLSNQTLAWTFTNTAGIVSSPLICPDGSVVYGCEDGFLYCLWGSSLPAGPNAPWPTFHQNAQRTGLQPGTNTLADNCGAPFVCDGTNNGAGTFTFDAVGPTNSSWSVYYSDNLSNWTKLFSTNVTLHPPAGNPTAPGTNTIIDDTVLGVTNRYYQLSNSTCCSKAIGFTRLMLSPGTNLIADQLCQVDDGVMTLFDQYAIPDLGLTMNDLNGLFDAYPWATNMGGSSIFQWNGSGFNEDINGGGRGDPPAWAGGGNMTLLPGNSVIISNALSVSYPIWFTGLVRNQQIFSIEQGPNHLIPTTNYLSATVPVAGAITNITGYRPLAGDIIQLWNSNSNKFVAHTNTAGSWSNGGLPPLSIGQGFVLITTNAYVWTNNWLTGVCGE